MSYWVSLEDADGERFESKEKIVAGGTYQFGGTAETTLNVTYNYGAHYAKHLDANSLRWLDGKNGAETQARLAHAVTALGVELSHDYWDASPGNAGYALSILFRWAKEFPNGVWQVN